MRAVIQRVKKASISIDGTTIAEIGRGILALVAIARDDTRENLIWTARKILDTRIFDDDEGKLNLSLQDVKGELLLVSQFTLFGDCRKGRRPSYIEAAPPAEAEKLYNEFVQIVREMKPDVKTGKFQAVMDVSLLNAGPVTIILDTRKSREALDSYA
jgi:D-aminoacyl-tRNA deacylase